MRKREQTTGAKSRYGCRTLETLEGETLLEYYNTGKYMGNIMQNLFYFERGGLTRTTTTKLEECRG